MKEKELKPEDLNEILDETHRELVKLTKSIKDLRDKIEFIKNESKINANVDRIKKNRKIQLKCQYTIEDVRDAANDWLTARGETELVCSNTRTFNVKVARHIAWLILKNYGYGTQAIGNAFNKNHSSVVVGTHRTASLLSINDKYYVHAYKSITQILKTYYGQNSEHTGDTGEIISAVETEELA